MLTTRISILVIIILGLFLLAVAAYDHRHPAVGSNDGIRAADRRRTSAGVVGDHKDMEKPILWKRKMIATPPRKSPSGPHNFRHQRRLLGTSSEHEDGRPLSPATKNSAGDDAMTKMKEEIICSGVGKHNHA